MQLEVDVLQDRLLASRIAEGHVAKLDLARQRLRLDRLGGLLDRGNRVHDLLEAPRACLGPRHKDDKCDGHHQREEDLEGVLHEGRQVADRQLAAVHQVAPEPEDRDRRQVHDQQHGRERDGEQAVDAERSRGEVVVRLLETAALEVLADEGADHANAGDLLAHHLVDAVDLALHQPEQRDRLDEQEGKDCGEHRDDKDQHRGELHVRTQSHDHAADGRDRRAHHHRERDLHEKLNLLHVVRVASDQRGGADAVHLSGGEALDPAENDPPQVPAESLRGERSPINAGDREHEGDAEHDGACAPDVTEVAFGDAVVDDVRVQVRQVEVADRLDKDQHHHDRHLAEVGAEIVSEKADQQDRLIISNH